jgi:hypothetical protein
LVCGAYFFFQSLAQSSVGYLSHRHQSLAPIMLFNLPGSLSPCPPIDFGLQTFSQLTRAHFFFQDHDHARGGFFADFEWF